MNNGVRAHIEFETNDTCALGRLTFLMRSFLISLILNNNNTAMYGLAESIILCALTINTTAHIQTDRQAHTHNAPSFVYTEFSNKLSCFPFVLKFNQPIFMCRFCGRINAKLPCIRK